MHVSFFRDVAPLIGPEATLRLIEARGGRRVKVPAKLTEASSLAGVIGGENVAAMQRVFASCTVKVPLAKAMRVKLYRARGMSHSEIAGKLAVSESFVAAVLKRAGLSHHAGIAGRAAERQRARRVPPTAPRAKAPAAETEDA